MSSIVNAGGSGPEIIQALQGWQIAKELANRANRDLLQFAAGITVVLGSSSWYFETNRKVPKVVQSGFR